MFTHWRNATCLQWQNLSHKLFMCNDVLTTEKCYTSPPCLSPSSAVTYQCHSGVLRLTVSEPVSGQTERRTARRAREDEPHRAPVAVHPLADLVLLLVPVLIHLGLGAEAGSHNYESDSWGLCIVRDGLTAGPGGYGYVLLHREGC